MDRASRCSAVNLDAMPGKQMAIDADLSAGLIDEQEARRRRKQLEDESSFLGATDSASKFAHGDAIAGLLVVFINIVGGMIIGIAQQGISFADAASSYTVRTGKHFDNAGIEVVNPSHW